MHEARRDIHSTFLLRRCHFTAGDSRRDASNDGGSLSLSVSLYLVRARTSFLFCPTISKSYRRTVSQILRGGASSRLVHWHSDLTSDCSYFVSLVLLFSPFLSLSISSFLSLSIMDFRCSLTNCKSHLLSKFIATLLYNYAFTEHSLMSRSLTRILVDEYSRTISLTIFKNMRQLAFVVMSILNFRNFNILNIQRRISVMSTNERKTTC